MRIVVPATRPVVLAVCLSASHLLPAASMNPVVVSGFNRDLVIESTAVGPPYSSYAVELNPGENLAFYQSGLPGKSYGLPLARTFTSALDGDTVFRFEPYTGNNALVLSTSTGLNAGTLTLWTPGKFTRLAVIAHSAGGGGSPALTLNFSDRAPVTTNYAALDWFYNAGYALAGSERVDLTSGATTGAPDNPRFYQTTLDLLAMGLASNTLTSITFNQATGAGATGIYAVSGELAAPPPETPASITAQPQNVTVPELSAATFTASVGGYPSPTLQWYRGDSPIPDATNLSYTITATAVTDNGALFRLVAANVASNVSYSVTSSAALLTVTPIMKPLVLSGYNRDVVIESTASGPPYSSYAVVLPGEASCFYQSGLPGKSYGLPAGGAFLSVLDGTAFQFQPYTGNNALALSSTTGSSGTLTLATPDVFRRVAVIAHSGSGGGSATLTFNFTDGTTYTATYNAPDWFNNTGYALAGVERINPDTGATSGATTNPRFYQTVFDLAALFGPTNKALASITFVQAASSGCTVVYAVSGEIMPPAPAGIVTHPTDLTVGEMLPATFSATVSGNPFPALQWYRGATAIAGATNLSLTLSAATLGDDGATFRLVATNLIGGTTYAAASEVATLTVRADTNAPVLLGALSLGLSQVQARFSERMLPATATNLSNYAISGAGGSVTLSGASLDASQSNVVLAVAPMLAGSNYTLTVNGLKDLAATPNLIATNSQAAFIASAYAPAGIGNPVPAGSLTPVGNGFNLAGSGADLGGSADQCQFNYVSRTGDFDIRVRLDSLTLADAWTEAGMVAREDLSPGARGASVMATPSISGCYFQSRSTASGATTLAGSFPVNFPNTWLRLKRAGTVFAGYAGFDGESWTQLGSTSLDLPATIYFGFAVASHSAGQLGTAAFRDLSDTTNAAAGTRLPREPLAQCSRRTSLVISEIMYHPTNAALEFVEVFNSRGEFADLSGWQLGGNISYTFPAGTLLPGGGFVVVALSPAALEAACGISGVLGPFAGNLPNSSGTVTLISQGGGVCLQVDYSDQPPWPVAADGAGHSLTLARPSLGENQARAWAASDALGGSPGRLDPYTPDPLRRVLVNEFLAHTDPPSVDYVELYNASAQALDLSGCVLTDDAVVDKFILPSGASIAAFGRLTFTETQLGFALSAAGETLLLKNPSRTRVLDAVRFGGQENGVATGRWPDGSEQFYPLTAQTPGTPNAVPRTSDVVLNELMYHPISGDDDDQYVELHNRGTAPVSLAGWTLDDGINFTFPTNAVIAPGGYVVVARLAARLMTNYPALNATNTFGDFNGKLSGAGERVALTKPDTIVSTNAGGSLTTNLIQIVVDEVTYGTGGRWPELADGGGSSLERIDPRANGRLPSAWADSDETAKAPWKIVSATGTVDNGSTTADQLQILLQGAGECLVDNVQVLTAGGNNLVTNSTFEGGAGGWTAEGTMSQSSLETTGYSSARSYHLRAVDRGDNQVNRVRTPLSASLASGTANVTISAAVRWLKGHPDLLLRLRGNWLECVGEMALPVSPGTPGARNSRYVTNAPPAITEVCHSPALPAGGESIVVTARVEDSDGLGAVQLRYRLDPAVSYTLATMVDNGTGGDAVPGDGVFTATIPGVAAGSLIAFHVLATDAYSPVGLALFPKDAPTRECLVRVGETQPTGNFPVYRLWMTQTTLNTWTSRNKLDNTPNDVTFVLGDGRVIYNAQALYAGSPYIAPGYCGPACGSCGYTVTLPKDDRFLGETDLVLDWPGGHGGETTALQEQMGYWIADRLNLAFSHRYTIRLHVNGVTDEARHTVFEAMQQPAKGFLQQWAGDDSGQFFKIDRAFEFNDSGGLITAPEPRLADYTTIGGAKKREKYRWTFMYRSADRMNDYTNLFALVDALNSTAPEPYNSATYGLVEVEQWMRIFASEHIMVNFDAYGHEIGKNMYAYLPTGGKWLLYMCDLDWLMLAAPRHNSSYAPSTAPLFNSEDPTISTMYAFPSFARAYWRAVEDAANGPLAAASCDPVMDAKYQSLLANGIAWCDSQVLTDPGAVKTWFTQRRAALQAQLAAITPAFSVNPAVTVSNGLGVLTGLAPVGVYTVAVNGAFWPVTWTSVSNWIARVPLQPGANSLSVVGVAVSGQPVPGASNTVSVVYGGTVPSPVGAVVINEIMFSPALPGAEYVELFNTSTNYAFDLSGWDFSGLGYTFPNGAQIGPRQFLVLVKDRALFDMAYGRGVAVFDEYAGNLQSDGETLTLIRRGANSASDLVVARVRYSPALPWPAGAEATGSSLQLVDPLQDNWRAGNWATTRNSVSYATPQWVNVTTTGTPASSSLYVYLESAGDIYLDDLTLARTSGGSAGVNVVSNGNFETTLTGPWSLSPNFTSSALSTAYKHGGNSSLHLVATGPGSGSGNAISQTISPSLNTTRSYQLGFWYLQTTNGGPLTVRISNGGITTTVNPAPPLVTNTASATPGAANVVAAVLPAFPPLWLNELQAENLTGPTNRAGQRTAWLELYNPSTNTVSLNGLYLASTYTNLTQWAFPSNATIAPGQFKVIFADGQTGLTTTNELHTSFTLPAGAGALALSRLHNGQPQVLDYVNYAGLPPNHSYGSFPDGQSFDRQDFFYFTPGATNNGTSAPLTVFINEWMADNVATRADPADSDFEDWFELYNPGTNAVNLGGCFLSDTLTNKFQFEIPNNGRYVIPPRGFLLVWADSESKQNSTNRPDLHVNFKLDKAGEAIGLFAADGTTVDYVSFLAQKTDVSEGRSPDGSAMRYSLPWPTPGTNNPPVNTAPVLAPIGNAFLHAGQTLELQASATDAESATQMLTFSLDPGAPSGATINATNGLLTWTPTPAQVPGTNAITVRVTDNGVPPLSANRSFTVTVLPVPMLTAGGFDGGTFLLGWLGLPGQTYQVEFKNDLSAPLWTPLASGIPGTGAPLTFEVDVTSAPRGFYRVVVTE